MTGFTQGNLSEKAGAIGDLMDIAVGLGLSAAATSSLAKEISKFTTSSGNLISRGDLMKLQQYLKQAEKVTASKFVHGVIENIDRLNGFAGNVGQLND